MVSAVLWLLGTIVLNLGRISNDVPDLASYLTSIGERLSVFAFWIGANSVVPAHLAPMLVGAALFEVGALHRPADHLGLHRRRAVAGLGVGLLGAVPLCLVNVESWAPSDAVVAIVLGLHAVTGLCQKIVYVSVIALWSARRPIAAPQPVVATVLAAIGRRSLTVYLVHSVLLGVTLSAWAFNLAPRLTTASTYTLGLGVWAVCAGVALLLSAAAAGVPPMCCSVS